MIDRDTAREEFMEIVYGELHSDGDNNRANRIIDAADEYADKSIVHCKDCGHKTYCKIWKAAQLLKVAHTEDTFFCACGETCDDLIAETTCVDDLIPTRR